MNWRCFFGRHDWRKMGGPRNVGSGIFEQRLICERCKKVSYRRS